MPTSRIIRAMAALCGGVAAVQAQGTGCGRDSVPSFGIATIDCVQCTIHEGWVAYGTEPTVAAVIRGSDAERVLQRGDVIMQVGRKPVTTTEGSRNLASPQLGQPMHFMARRGAQVTAFQVTPSCQPRSVVGAGADSADRKPLVAAPPAAGRGGTVAQPGPGTSWLGFALRPVMGAQTDPNSPILRTLDSVPAISFIERGSPAEKAGLRVGERLVSVDGLPIYRGGWQRLSVARPGEAITLRLHTPPATNRDVKLVMGELPAPRSGGTDNPLSALQNLFGGGGAARPNPDELSPVLIGRQLGMVMVRDSGGDPAAMTDWVLRGVVGRSPAETAGMRAGDQIISLYVEPGGGPLVSARGSVTPLLPPGQGVRITYRRDGQVRVVRLVAGGSAIVPSGGGGGAGGRGGSTRRVPPDSNEAGG